MSITEFKHDLFISYSPLDNQPLVANESGWVDQFGAHLEYELAKRYGRRNEVNIWRDSKLTGSDVFDEVVQHNIQNAGLFLALLSPSYLKSEWTKTELGAFVQTAKSSSAGLIVKNRSRVLPILLYDVPREDWPDELREIVGFHLFSTRNSNQTAPLTPDDGAYRMVLTDLAEEILRSLRDLSITFDANGSQEPQPSPQRPPESRQTEMEVQEHDIFISYAREDSTIAAALAKRLETEHWRVFWDRSIPIGQTWDKILETKLDAVSSVVVLWSKASVASEWVLLEAYEGLEQGKLVPTFIEDVRAPLRFRRLQGAQLVGWDQLADTPELQNVVDAIGRLIKSGATDAS